jgi:hypothetical protein
MRVISLIRIIETAFAAAGPDVKHIKGELLAADDLFSDSKLMSLDSQHRGVFAFLAFHPAFDSAILDALVSGRFDLYTGTEVLLLFTVDASSRIPREFSAYNASWLSLSTNDYPAYRLARSLLIAGDLPALPGLFLLDRIWAPSEPVYVPLMAQSGKTFQDIADIVFRLAISAYRAHDNAFAERLCTALAREGIDYVRVQRRSLREWLYFAYRLARQHGGDLVTLAKVAAGLGRVSLPKGEGK